MFHFNSAFLWGFVDILEWSLPGLCGTGTVYVVFVVWSAVSAAVTASRCQRKAVKPPRQDAGRRRSDWCHRTTATWRRWRSSQSSVQRWQWCVSESCYGWDIAKQYRWLYIAKADPRKWQQFVSTLLVHQSFKMKSVCLHKTWPAVNNEMKNS